MGAMQPSKSGQANQSTIAVLCTLQSSYKWISSCVFIANMNIIDKDLKVVEQQSLERFGRKVTLLLSLLILTRCIRF
jgi:hypothetical protein